jgi:hypothetical protein
VNIQFILVPPGYHQSPPQPLLLSFEPKSLKPGLHQVRLRLKQLGTRDDPRSKQLLGGCPSQTREQKEGGEQLEPFLRKRLLPAQKHYDRS